MKTKILNLASVLIVSGGMLAGQSLVMAADPVDYTKLLASASVVEMPAQAASLVTHAAKDSQKDVTAAVVKAAVGLNSSAAVAIVGAVARANPDMASTAAVTAASLQAKQIGLIASAAAVAAPSQAANIVDAMIKASPSDYAVIAISASKAVPSAGRQILAVVAKYVPALQAGLDKALTAFSATDVLPVADILTQVNNDIVDGRTTVAVTSTASTSSPADAPVRTGFSVGPPFTPITSTPTYITPSETQPQVPGGRTASSP
ncbi:MAG: hypothetical protein ABSA47_06240 [Verrucomicrobiota bacterium]